jgi:protein YIPF4
MQRETTESGSNFVSLSMPESMTSTSNGGSIQAGTLDFLPSSYNYDARTMEMGARYDPTTTGGRAVGFESDENQMRHRGRLGGYMDKYGVGWLLDQNSAEIDDEDSKPLLEELDINLGEIKYKIKCVMAPVSSQTLNRSILRENPDFWGPLLIVLAFALISVYGQFRVISWIITIWIFGSFIIFVIARVLGGEVTYSQIVGTIGYSLLPLLLIATLVPFLNKHYYLSNLVKVSFFLVIKKSIHLFFLVFFKCYFIIY